MPTVLWGAKRDDIQFGSLEDLIRAKSNRRVARALRGLSRAMQERQLLMHRLGMSPSEAHTTLAKDLAKAARLAEVQDRFPKRRAS